jgi:hypothetical protein
VLRDAQVRERWMPGVFMPASGVPGLSAGCFAASSGSLIFRAVEWQTRTIHREKGELTN